MPRVCSVCTSDNRSLIDKALVAGKPLRTIADRWSVSKTALIRHKADHLPASLVEADKAQKVANADDLLANVCKLQTRAERIFRKAEKQDDHRVALSAIRELRSTLELMAKLLGELKTTASVNVLVSPEYQSVRTAIMEALAPYPKARVRVAKALQDLPHVGP